MIVNLNCLCKVQLNDFGKQIWLNQIEELPEELRKEHPEIVEAITAQIKPDDTITLELWSVMNVFGPYMSQLHNPFKGTSVELLKNPIFNKQVD